MSASTSQIATLSKNPSGSVWNRWDPHIHAPGTILNDQYRGDNAWDDFLKRIEDATPAIAALGITDYLSIDLYKRVMVEREKGRLQNVCLMFPNVEMRFGVSTASNSPINFHLMVNSHDADHVEEIHRLLLGLTFTFNGDEFRCERSDLVRLGHAYSRTKIDDDAALKTGTNQFKVNPDQFRNLYRKNDWAKANIVIAVAGGSRDGTSGLQENASFTALRQQLERDAHVIFSSQAKQREFWLGRGALSVGELTSTYGGRKPCMHGSDAHTHASVAAPSNDRYCWIKGDVTFESLWQACLEPDGRAFVGAQPPTSAMPSKVISRVRIQNAPWISSPDIPLNPGLVAIIGARGSGKTALADLIAAGATALSPQLSERSFVSRAAELLGDSKVTLLWADDHSTENELKHVSIEEMLDEPRVRYLSQQFVDQLCSSEGLTDSLVQEVERVVFQAHGLEARMGTTSFCELRELKTAALRASRSQFEEAIKAASTAIIDERALKERLADAKQQRKNRTKSITNDKRDRQRLVTQGQAERGAQLEKVSEALDEVRGQVDAWKRRHQQLAALKNEVAALRKVGAPATLRKQQATYTETGLTQEQWKSLLVDVREGADKILADSIENAAGNLAAWKGPREDDVIPDENDPPAKQSLIASGKELAKQSLALLSAEEARIRALLGIDAENTKQFKRLSDKISNEGVALAKLTREIEHAERADERIAGLVESRAAAYQEVFDAIEREQAELSQLYQPLGEMLKGEDGALSKLGFAVRRIVNAGAWATNGEALFDLRATGPFRGKGALLDAAKDIGLIKVWETGSAEDVAGAMAAFREKYGRQFIEQCPVDRRDREALRGWLAKVYSWLYGTEHISVTYGVQYEQVDLERLSQGTRGIVLLLLYLSIDAEDDRPLIIDQPEENLDPKSIFDELVGRFKSAKQRRQIIIVTHNANLVVNADADQVIVASAGPHVPGKLPKITYVSGGLENDEIRGKVCDILEGGAAAFRERAKRLRVSIP